MAKQPRQTAKRLRAVEGRDKPLATSLTPHRIDVDRGLTRALIGLAVAAAAFLSIHLETLRKDPSRLLVDEKALLQALSSGHVRAALDVFDQEPLADDHPFRQMDNVLLTPHVAGATAQARSRQGQTVVDEIRRYVGGEELRYEVTADMLDIMA